MGGGDWENRVRGKQQHGERGGDRKEDKAEKDKEDSRVAPDFFTQRSHIHQQGESLDEAAT